MGKKFMIVKPTPCCNYNSDKVEVYEARTLIMKELLCGHCNVCLNCMHVHFEDGTPEGDFVELSRVEWIIDKNDVIEYDQQNNIEETAKA